MISLMGSLCLLLAFLSALCQGVFPLIGYYRKNPYFSAVARPSAFLQCFFVVVAYLLLTLAFYTNDFSIAYVAANSHPTLPLLYRLTAVWGAHEGSILLWIVILNLWTIIFAISKQSQPALVIALLGIISFAFLSFLLLTSNPFLPAAFLQSGQDLNPLLQDVGFVIHPPMLYAGYVGFSVAFAITEAGLLTQQLDETWARLARHYAIAAWCFLTFGITLGSWWAYRVLGWGGFWFWDPVENASLLPWLSGTALIHVLLLAEKRGMAKGFAALLGITTFALSLLGTFLVRSGVLISAHTFANDPARGVFLLLLLAVLITAALVIYVVRLPSFTKQALHFSWLSREMALLVNAALLFLAMATILLGTLYPLIVDALHLGSISVGAPYFNRVMLPLVLIILFCMGLAPLCAWQTSGVRRSTAAIISRGIKNMLLSFITALVLLWGIIGDIEMVALLTLSLSFWVMLSLRLTVRLQPGMTLAHLGFAILVIGIILSSTLNEERELRVQPGMMTTLGPYQFFFTGTEGIQGANYRGVRATFVVSKNAHHVTTLYPEKRIYTVRDMVMTKVAIHPGLFRDLYIALGEPYEQASWSVRLYYKPFVRWIWFGGLVMIIGGILAILTRKKYQKIATMDGDTT